MKRGQMEIIGLVIIVIIITMAFLFSITFKVKSGKLGQKSTYANDQLATNFLLALMKTDETTCNAKIREIIYDCAGSRKMTCQDGKDACYHMNQTLAYILAQSLDILQSKYSLRIVKMPENAELTRFEKNCGPNQPKGMQGYQPIRLFPIPGDVEVTLDVCG